jgi:hypothetical protein
MSIPRCWPAAYGSSPSKKGRSTGPCTGHVQPKAEVGHASAVEIAAHTRSRIGSKQTLLVVRYANTANVARSIGVVKSDYSEER